jgi:hypothetical protein
MEEHSTLLQKFAAYGRKKFYSPKNVPAKNTLAYFVFSCVQLV